jgi:hypothetical protein
MTITDLFYQLGRAEREQMATGRDPKKRLIKAVRLGAAQYMLLRAEEAREVKRYGPGIGYELEQCAGIRFYMDETFDGVQVEYVEETPHKTDAVRAICKPLGLSCRAY